MSPRLTLLTASTDKSDGSRSTTSNPYRFADSTRACSGGNMLECMDLRRKACSDFFVRIAS
jgi:hypothetical protein